MGLETVESEALSLFLLAHIPAPPRLPMMMMTGFQIHEPREPPDTEQPF